MILRFTIRYPDVGSVILFPVKSRISNKNNKMPMRGKHCPCKSSSTNQEPMTKSYWTSLFLQPAYPDPLDHAVRLHQAEYVIENTLASIFVSGLHAGPDPHVYRKMKTAELAFI
ncbi:hypothetical protein P7H06_15825 [Paenibacillus larvae]|nr:hypothetical protein [Paenibacillus larvae]MDT2260685.1 hypothetical protein [Paenibacillus larvae]